MTRLRHKCTETECPFFSQPTDPQSCKCHVSDYDMLAGVCTELAASLEDALLGLEVTETCLISWNKTGAPCNVEYIRARGDAALAKALPFVGVK